MLILPLDATKTEMYITPVSGSGADSNFYVVTSIEADGSPDGDGDLYSSSITGTLTQKICFLKSGDYDVRVVVYNTRGISDTTTKRITIEPDIPPVVDFSVPTVGLRDQPDGNGKFFDRYVLVDMSYSTDNDVIYKRVWKYRYDSTNKKDANGNPDFTGEPWIVLDNTNKTTITFDTPTDGVGFYQWSLDVSEDPNQ